MQDYNFTVNQKKVVVQATSEMTVLWVLRDMLGLCGTKYGCGVGVCGACTILMDQKAVRSCQIPVSALAGKSITTIEGLSADGNHPVQRAWEEVNVPQCGYCQPGQIMNVVALLANPQSDAATIDAAMSQVVCRCGTYHRIQKAIEKAISLTPKK